MGFGAEASTSFDYHSDQTYGTENSKEKSWEASFNVVAPAGRIVRADA